MGISKQTQPRGIRNHNPGNIRKSTSQWQGINPFGIDADFEVFTSPTYGIRALARTLITYYKVHGLTTIRGIISRWAPPGDNNNTDAYIFSVSSQSGIGPDDTLLMPGDLENIIPAIIKHENGVQPYSAELITDSIKLAMV